MPDATAAALLSTEAKALAVLRQVVAVHGPRRAGPALASAIVQVRQAARREGARTMGVEVRQALPVMPALPDVDRKHADRAVAGYLKALDVAGEKQAAGARVSLAGVAAGKLDLIAATEVPSAFSDERQRIERRVVQDNPTLIPILLKRWNARLDACPVCKKLDGTSRPWGVDFPNGQVPGQVHPNCFCVQSYMPIPVVLRGRVRVQESRNGGVWEWVE